MNPFDQYHKRQRYVAVGLVVRWLLEAAAVVYVLSRLDTLLGWPW
jgi:hypothetical protein